MARGQAMPGVSSGCQSATTAEKPMIKPWIFEFLYAPGALGEEVGPQTATTVFDSGVALWQRIDRLGFEGIFFSEHHFGLSYSPSPNLLIAAIARSTERLRLCTMGIVLPLYPPWRALEELGLRDHPTGGPRENRAGRP